MKYLALSVVFLSTISPSLVVAERSSRLKVSATIPPRPCEYPERCDNATRTAQTKGLTQVTVAGEKIRYVGSPPTVERKDDLLVVKF